MTAIVAAFTGNRDAAKITDLVTASNDAGDGSLEIAAEALELDLVKRHPIPARTDPLGITTIIKVNVPEAEITSFTTDGAATGANRNTFGFAIVQAVARMTIAIIARIADRAVTLIAQPDLERAISGLDRDAPGDSFARLTVIGERWRSEEQRRRKGKRGCSGGHDAFHHGCRKT